MDKTIAKTLSGSNLTSDDQPLIAPLEIAVLAAAPDNDTLKIELLVPCALVAHDVGEKFTTKLSFANQLIEAGLAKQV